MCAERIRESIIAGSWYPDNPDTLRNEIAGYLERARPHPGMENLIGLVAPHAGYMYSGEVAAHAYRQLEGARFDRVLIVAPSHRTRFPSSTIYHLGGFRTPLGVVPLDVDLVQAFLEHPQVRGYYPQAEDQEHSLEIQLPFLQVVLGEFKLVPIIMGNQAYEHCTELAELIEKLCRNKNVLLIASSDLSHYHTYREAKQLDGIVTARVAAFDCQGLFRDLNDGACEACGAGPMVAVMLAAGKLGANVSRVLHYANSGDVTGERSGVVGYMAAAFYRE